VSELHPDKATSVDQKQVIDIVFSLKTQATKVTNEPRGIPSSTHNHPFELKMAVRQSFNLTSKAKPEYGVDQRSSQFRVEE